MTVNMTDERSLDPCVQLQLAKDRIQASGSWGNVHPIAQELLKGNIADCSCGTDCQKRFNRLKLQGENIAN